MTYMPYIQAAGELKSKPTQHSVKALREIGIQPDMLICRSERHIPHETKSKIGLFCSIRPENVISAYDANSIYEVPLMLHKEGFDEKVVTSLELDLSEPNLENWKKMVNTVEFPQQKVNIGIVGKYTHLIESYKSLNEALTHGGLANDSRVNVTYINCEKLKANNVAKTLSGIDGLLVPGGFGERGAEGKMTAIQYARENNIPFLGICFGMQLAAIEFARHVCGLKNATSQELENNIKGQRNFVIHMMEDQKSLDNKGGTMRLGAFPCNLAKGSIAKRIYKKSNIMERHRHRFEFNNKFKGIFNKHGMTFSGLCNERNLVEIMELPEHIFFIGVQFHPEFKSKPLKPHPLFVHFIKSSLKNRNEKISPKKTIKQNSHKVLSKTRRNLSVTEAQT